MKKLILFTFLFCLSSSLAIAQSCLPNGIVFNSQAEIDAFIANNPNCTNIEGSVTISGNDISNLDSLISIIGIDSNLIIVNCPQLVDMEGLNNLNFIGQNLLIRNNSSIQDLNGLDDLSLVGHDFQILKNARLETLDGIDNIQSIGYNFKISENPKLRTLHGVESLSQLGGDLMITINKSLPSLERFANLSEIGGSLIVGENEALVSLIGLESLTQIMRHVVIYENAIFSLSGLDFLRSIGGYLEIRDNQDLVNLQGFETLLSIEQDVIIFNNNRLQNILGLELLTVVKRDLIIQENDALTSLNGLNEIYDVFGNLRVLYNDNLNNLIGLDKLIAVGGNLDIRGNDILIDLSGLNQLSSIEGDLIIKYNAALQNVNALFNLKSIWGRLEIEWNNLLEGLEGLDNIDYNSITSLIIKHNKKLSVCHVQSICEYIQFKTPVQISDNDGGCNSVTEVENHCLNNLISGIVFFDFNQNKVRDPNEFGIPNMTVSVNPGNHKLISNSRGVYAFYRGIVDTTYTLTWDVSPDWSLTTDSSAFHVVYSPANPRLSGNDFGLFPDSIQHNVKAVTTSKRTRCNFTIPFYTTVRNEGAFLEKGQVQLKYDPLMTFVSSSIIPSSIDVVNHILTWDFDSLYPYETIDLVNEFEMPGVQNIGTVVNVETSILLDSSGTKTLHSNSIYSSAIVCSYDPNDKSVSPVGKKEAKFILKNQPLFYTVRFQNTGNIEAIDVRIEDQLSEFLDWTTLNVIHASHPVQTSIDENGKVTFLFKDIFLPDSTSDYKGSQGLIYYEIWPLQNVPDFTVVNNTAHIYFDLNPPIITNTTYSTLVDKIPTTTSIPDPKHGIDFTIHPNPVLNDFRISWSGDEKIKNIKIIDPIGKSVNVLSHNDNSHYSIGSISPGLYILEIVWSDSSISNSTFIVTK